ncbi:glycerophosphodiester phosphodiesterase family protein, partial [Pantoea sp. SIMBA_133]
MSSFHIYGHRGSSGTHPENTLISFQAAHKAGAQGIELDVQLTKDLVPVVIHDERLERTTNGIGFVKDFLY